MGKTGLYFGSFNPIHMGHLIIAEYMLEHSDLEEVWFVVSPRNPLKEKSSLLADEQRLHMVKLAIEGDSRFKASDVEFGMPQPSYTCRTLACLSENHPGREFCLLMGEDNLATFDQWLNHEWILDHYRLYVYPRPGYDAGKRKGHPNVTMIDAPLLQLSSTLIRKSIRQGKRVQYMLPEKVAQYMDEMHLYEP